ncbi:MAG: ATP-binding cassette domain-containing protein [Desulfuromonadales bacterium]|nr:ATP-binding cassette domain-containing protein [Desulfuromonadales bacterium]
MTTLRLEAVRKSRPGNGGPPVEILRGVSLTAQGGALTVIIGPSGGGKSTLMRLLNRLEDPDGGEILLGGRNILEFDPLELRRRVGMAPQKPFMFPGSVLANLQLPFRLRGEATPGGAEPAIVHALELCRLPADLLPRDARTLSLGQQQRVSLARALVAGPELLLLDEPTSALDRPPGDRLADTLHDISRSRQLTIVMMTHDLRLAERVADHLAYLEDGRILEEGVAADLLNRPRSAGLRRFLDQPMETQG